MPENEQNSPIRMPDKAKSSFLVLLFTVLKYAFTIVLSLIVISFGLEQILDENATLTYAIDSVFEVLFLFVPFIVFMKVGKYDYKETLRLNPLSVKEALLIAVIGVLAYFAGTYFVESNYLIAEIFTDVTLPTNPPLVSASDKIMAVFSIAFIAPVVEELTFRGAVMRGLEGRSKWFAIIVTGALFGLLHFSYFTMVQKIFMGIILCLVAYTADSVYASMIVHVINNSISVLMSILTADVAETAESAEELITEIPSTELAVMGFVYFFIAASITVGIVGLLILLKKMTNKPTKDGRYVAKGRIRERFPFEEKTSPAVVVCLVLTFVIDLFLTFV